MKDEYFKTIAPVIENNIFVRNLLHSDLLINTLRISIGTNEQMNIVVDVLKKVKS